MTKINWKQKLSSRKFWMALIGVAGGVVAAIYDNPTEGAALVIASIVGYLAAEGYIDGKAAAANANAIALAITKIDNGEDKAGGSE